MGLELKSQKLQKNKKSFTLKHNIPSLKELGSKTGKAKRAKKGC
jgi:hypothetical protein